MCQKPEVFNGLGHVPLEQNLTELNRRGFPRVAKYDSHCVLGRRPARMAKPLSEDLRIRIIQAVEGGM